MAASLPSVLGQAETFKTTVPDVDRGKVPQPPAPSTITISLQQGRGASPPVFVPSIHSGYGEISEKAKKIALARFDLLRAWEEYRKKSNPTLSLFSKKNNKIDADKEFLQGYNSGHLYLSIYNILGKVSVRTLYNWKSSLGGSDDWTCLIPQNFKTCGYPKLSQGEASTFMRFLLHPNKIKIGTAVRLTQAALQNKGIQTDKSAMTFRRFAEVFKRDHYDR